MREIFKENKRWIFWGLISYIVIFSILYVFVLIPQKNLIIKYKTEKELLEYNYFKIKSSPKFFDEIRQTVAIAKEKIGNFEWLKSYDDPNLAIYEYLQNIGEKTGVEIISIKEDEEIGEKEENIYFFWDVQISGPYYNLFSFVYNLENEKNYLKIEEIEVIPGEEEKNNNFFILKISAIKEVK